MLRRRLLALTICLAVPTFGAAEDLASAIKTLRSVEKEGAGNAAASAAWKTASAADAKDLPKLLAAFDGANPLAMNWIQTAVDAVVQRAGANLSKDDLLAFLRDHSHSPEGRRTAYELILKLDPGSKDALLDSLLDDPSGELKRDAVQHVYAAGENALKAKKKEEALKLFEKALTASRDEDQVKDAVKQVRGLGTPVDVSRHFGFLNEWKVIGPFDNVDDVGYAAVYSPENSLDFSAEPTGKEGKLKWVDYVANSDYGVVDLNKALGKKKGSVAYAVTEFTADKAGPAEIRLGSFTACIVWLNGKKVFSRHEYHSGFAVDQYKAPIELQAGKNTLLLKICQNEQKEAWAQNWQFQARICDWTGKAILSSTRPAAKPLLVSPDPPEDDGSAPPPPKTEAKKK